jgi:hypothetical protein
MRIYSLFQWCFIVVPATFLLMACDVPTNSEEENSEEPEENILIMNELYDKSTAYHGQIGFRTDIAKWSYENGYEWVSGLAYRDNSQLKINVTKSDQSIELSFTVSVSGYGEYPTVRNSSFGDKEEADYLEFGIEVTNNKNKEKFRLAESESISSDSTATFLFKFTPEQFRFTPAGMTDYTLALSTEFVSFFGNRSKKYPLKASLKMQYIVPKVYKTEVYFASLVLNKEGARSVLGSDNDFSNSDPETGIRVEYGGETFMYEFTENSYQLRRKTKAELYHYSKNDLVEISALDVDYGFNSNDLISSKRISLTDLEGTDYKNIELKHTDELKMYAKFIGLVNE